VFYKLPRRLGLGITGVLRSQALFLLARPAPIDRVVSQLYLDMAHHGHEQQHPLDVC
jgi:hypothetical protein